MEEEWQGTSEGVARSWGFHQGLHSVQEGILCDGHTTTARLRHVGVRHHQQINSEYLENAVILHSRTINNI